MENPTENQPTVAETPEKLKAKSINLGIGAVAEQFRAMCSQSGCRSEAEFVGRMLECYSNAGSSADMERAIADLRAENSAYEATRLNLEMEVENLKAERDEARSMANRNAEASQQALFEAQSRAVPDGAVVVMPGMVLQWLLDREAEKSGKKPADILQECFLAELQRVNSCTKTSVNRKELHEISERLSKQQAQ